MRGGFGGKFQCSYFTPSRRTGLRDLPGNAAGRLKQPGAGVLHLRPVQHPSLEQSSRPKVWVGHHDRGPLFTRIRLTPVKRRGPLRIGMVEETLLAQPPKSSSRPFSTTGSHPCIQEPSPPIHRTPVSNPAFVSIKSPLQDRRVGRRRRNHGSALCRLPNAKCLFCTSPRRLRALLLTGTTAVTIQRLDNDRPKP